MGIFSDYAELYWELGYSIIPVKPKEKKAFLDYDTYREKKCSYETLQKWVKKYPNYNIGIVPGAASGIGVIDIDIKNNPELLSKALKIFPRSPVERFGSKGLGIFFKFNGQSHTKIWYKGKDIGEIITNTQVVIPPSIHPDTKKEYIWTTYMSLDSDLKENILEELPCPTDAELQECAYKLENENIEVNDDELKKRMGRNDKLKTITGSLIGSGYLPEKIAPIILAEDFNLHPDNPLFSDAKEFKKLHKNPLACAYKFATSIFKTYLNQASYRGDDIPHFNLKTVKEEQKKRDFAKYESFFKDQLKHCKKDKIDGVLKEKDWRGFWQPVGNKVEQIKSYATDIKLKPEKIKMHFRRYESEKKAELLFDLPRWDGHDHIAEMFFHTASKNFTQSQMADFFKAWIAKAFSRIDTGDQNTMIIFHGKQGAGKDIFIENMLKGFSPYFNNFTDTSQDKDMYFQVSRNLILNVSEFDRLNRKHSGFIKDLISKRTAEFRPSHMQHQENFRMNASFIGSTNALNFLTDSTGNRRFWVFEDFEIDWDYPKNRAPQILAQAKVLSEEDYKVSIENLEEMVKYIANISPENLDEMFKEHWNAELEGISVTDKEFSFKEVKSSMDKIAKSLGFRSSKPVQSLVKRLGGQTRNTNNRVYHKIT